jgi:hypothetical protein
MLSENGYSTGEVESHFAQGASLFGAHEKGNLVACCFVFRNHSSVWEVGGV